MPVRVARRPLLIAALLSIGVISAGIAVWLLGPNPTGAGEEYPDTTAKPVTAAERELLRRAEERLIRHCMERNGFGYAEQPPLPPNARQFPYVVDDVAWARKYGFGDRSAGPPARERDVNQANLQRLTPDQQLAWQQALMGYGRQLTAVVPDLGRVSAPDNGCTAEAWRTLYGDLAGWYRARRVVDHFGVYLSNQVIGDPRYQTALTAWSACVRTNGYQVSTPNELRALVADEATSRSTEQARSIEVAAAETAARCAGSTGLSRTIRSLERSYRPPLERRFARECGTLAYLEQRAIPTAMQILADR